MTLPKNKLIIFFIFLIVIAIVAISLFSVNSCGIQHIFLITDLKKYEQSLDPEFCEMLVDRIDLFNDQCYPKIEILDCG